MLPVVMAVMVLFGGQATPEPPLPGVESAAQRSYERSGAARDGTRALLFYTVRFASERDAERAEPELTRRLPNLPTDEPPRETSAPRFGDTSAAYTGRVTEGDETGEVAVLVVRIDAVLFVWVAAGIRNDPLVDLLGIAEPFFGALDRDELSEAGNSAALLAVTPGLDDLPPGFVLDEEETLGARATPQPVP